MNRKLLDKIISEVSLDLKVENGTFSIEENDHMEALRDYLGKKGIDEESIKEFSNRVLEGKYPERQAYNINGILVTFPTPEYKKEAIKRGTHFEKDPTKGQSNLFGGTESPAPTSPSPSNKKKEEPTSDKPAEPKTNLPVSQAAPAPAGGETSPAAQPQTTAAPQQTPSNIEAEPVKEPTELPLPPVKSPKEKEADKNAIKTMLKGDDYMLERFSSFIAENQDKLDGDLLERIRYLINK